MSEDHGSFYWKVLEQVLIDYDPLRARPNWARMIAVALNCPERQQEIHDLLEDSRFTADVMTAKRDLVNHAIDTIKRHLPEIVANQLKLSRSTDQRTQFQANKDLLDRAGTGAISKIAINSPAMYREVVKDLLEDKPEEKAEDAPSE